MKKILITGCGSGLGFEAAIALANRGHYVYATTHTEEQANKLNSLNKRYNLPLESFKLDVLCKNDKMKVLKLKIDVLINNAAIGDSGSVAEIDINKYREVFETNVFGPIDLTQLVLKQMISNKEGRIIFLSSLAGRSPLPFLSPYCATKFALEAIVPSLNEELQVLHDVNIPVILIEPGSYATGFNQKNIAKQFGWMKIDSYFKNCIQQLEKKQYTYFKLTESTNINSIINEYIKAVEDKHPKKRYIAPTSQKILIKIKNTFSNK
ncbi:short-subunit dehydrogenase [Clostridium saccharoperbutylacetonicum]|uniref:Short-chain dehydrogenase/reductase SDR n=1 Tax=Clostridium saccharoperbutylacetonicum N1-4(HMT) TaxID=931276 RepID=M1M9Y9_9CLOT|nr:SDR family NAD(P)-dependent oxidoreductase [Clostridium saccharoperbutylacetonicum]AGF54744.1 short-chain dehydrogenase/reductase SDR [Clostridium saccharoperbutylacetonicum N1-4(HMT)]NRT58735.1 short-subunit dehydrogenase [Clostridium saccharoperbutylacetonicum]NSB27924.1 short-subunit dehydrogenase [Clostridium saccharoperbutylacetonicum]NSB41407.1 short-subunit dehydrogenase [Clostridium saccharoperbutylacetonicum]